LATRIKGYPCENRCDSDSIGKRRQLPAENGGSHLRRFSGDSMLYKLREGDHRIIYQILRKEKLILIHCIGHRKDVYRRR
jgi:mRNA-degrading endonuclease RelE of RelBE toxin-antitoxin system